MSRENQPSKRDTEVNLKPIREDDTFKFSCQPGISCFNKCCHEIDVMLTPFDVLRMKTHLGIRSDEFLARYTELQTLKDTVVPLLKLKMVDGEKCSFLGNQGCTIYENRPVVCRNYPTGVATQNPKEGQGSSPYFIIEEDMCKGHFEGKKWTIEEWKKNQRATELETLNKPWLQIVARLKSLRLNNDQDQKMNVFIMTSFDLDTFRSFVFDSSFLTRFEVSQETASKIKNDEEELLKFGFKWLEFALFAEGPIRPRK